ncbi:uncharacterized protein K444DRAFT_63728 [Hyaloscypha bicolor E]|uniref:Uncharacterized protein n=1 Tax=Hyaloscypha bicolor E TaxID=1095630 RepID=A0A2J6T096_9HELO|nr:uncharacterized protein K444DRAFT_63728 [Hyaloscypha bicolor E]PMD56437.1 hypothetical protein K444DRAFT_63728 [Hyaloscypha bicolor E]
MLLPVHQVGLSFTTIPGHSICTSTSQTIQISTSTAILGRSADVPLLGFMKRFMPTEALFLFSLPLLLIFISHSPTTWPTGLHKCAIGGGEGLFTIVESSNNIARFRLCSCHIPDPRIILPIAIGAEQHDLLPDPFSVCCAPRGSSKRRSQDGLIRPVTECRVQESLPLSGKTEHTTGSSIMFRQSRLHLEGSDAGSQSLTTSSGVHSTNATEQSEATISWIFCAACSG